MGMRAGWARPVIPKGCFVSNSSDKPSTARVRLRRHSVVSLLGIGLTLVAVVACTAGTSLMDSPGSSSGASSSRAASPTSLVSALPDLTIEPVVTRAPTPTPLPTMATSDLLSACDGKPVPGADPYAGTVHPLVVVYYESGADYGWWLGGAQYARDDWDINQKWFDGDWPSAIQLVVCLDPYKSIKMGSCGSYKRSGDNVVGQVIRYKWSETVRVVVASTGKTLQSKVVLGGTPTCHSKLDDPGGNPPWLIHGSVPNADYINTYAVGVSTQKVK